jgi:arylsulfatase A-like enzyme
MRRRDFLAAAAPGAVHGLSRLATHKLNVLFIAVDDLRPQLGCYGHRQMKTPNLDRLAREGLRFNRAYCQQAVCAPSRASLLTGARPDTTRIYDLRTPLNTVRPDLVSLPRHFKNHGYETVSLGKVYHHANEDPLAWSVPPWNPKGDWVGRGYLDPLSVYAVRQNDAVLRTRLKKAKEAGQSVQPPEYGRGPAMEAPDVPESAYPDGKICEKALEELRRLKDRPFFLAVGFHKPHLPFNAPKKYWDLYSPEDIESPARNQWPEDMPAVAGSNWGELRAYTGIPAQGPVDETFTRLLIHGYYACVSFTDALVGRLLAELDRLDLRQNTIVVLWGDHGWKLGDYGAWCKHTNFERDTRAPLLLSIPGQKNAGAATNALVEFVDIYPTLAEACGLEVPAHCEGLSMLPLVENPQRPWKAAAFSQYPRGKLMGYSIRTERWRYTEWIERETGSVTARELYDHSTEDTPGANLAGLAAYADTVGELSALLDRGRGWRRVQQDVRRRLRG